MSVNEEEPAFMKEDSDRKYYSMHENAAKLTATIPNAWMV